MKSFITICLLSIIYCNSVGQCTAPIITPSGPTTFCKGGSVTLSAPASDAWAEKAAFGTVAIDGAVGFSIGNKGYIGTGRTGGSNYRKDFWEYDPSNDTWTQKADFGGTARNLAVGFSIAGKGYIGTGEDVGGGKKDFWEYDPAGNTWIQKADFGGSARYGATGFGIGNKGYIGAGNFTKDFWEYDPSSDKWTQKADIGGAVRFAPISFSIGTKGYIGTGVSQFFTPSAIRKDFWEYDPATNAWTQKADLGGEPRYYATACNIGNKGLIVGGDNGNILIKDAWLYDPATNSWTRKADFPTENRLAAAFGIGAKGYMGTGQNNGGIKRNFYEYDPGYSYAWAPGGETTASITVSTSGNYSVTTTNILGCSVTSATRVTVNQSTNGEESVTACESYEWNGVTYTTSGDKTHLFPGGNSTGCDSTATLHLTINAVPTATISYNGSPYCATGTATVNQSGADGGTYSSAAGLSINANTGAINLAASTPGSYTVTYSFTKGGCNNTATTGVTINALPTATISYNGSPYCATGTASVIQTGTEGGIFSSAPGLSIDATTGTVDLGASAPGTYTVSYRFTGGSCSNTATAGITIDALPTATISYDGSPYCATGTASVIQTGAEGGTFSSAPGLSIDANTGTVNLAASTPGSYTVTYSFTSGSCSNTTTTDITINPQPTANIAYSGSPYCATGTASVTQTGQAGGTYTSAAGLSIDANTGVINLAASTAGTYTVTYNFTSRSCSNTATADITINALPTATIAYSGSPYCATGTATVNQTGVDGGTYTSAAGLSIDANTGAINLAASTPGTYTVTYSFTSGSCSNNATAGITINALPTATIAYSGSPYCATGTASVTQTGQAGGTYTAAAGLSINANTGAINLAASTPGTYTVTYSFTSGSCSNTATANVTINALQATAISYSGSPFCPTGTAAVKLTGQSGGTYSSATGLVIDANTGTIDLATSTAGTYTITYKPGNGSCSSSATTNVTIEALPITITASTITCNGGLATITVKAGGAAPFKYKLSGGLSFQISNIFIVAAGTYTITVQDANGCSKTSSPITISQPPSIIKGISAAPINCYGGTTTLTVTAGDGVPPYTYALDNGKFQSSSSFAAAAGTHAVTAMDSKGCIAIKSIAVSQPTALSVTVSATAISCNGGTTAVTVNATGGTPGYTGTGSFTKSAGTYTFTVKDAKGCTTSKTITITQPAKPLALTLVQKVNVSCLNGSNGSVKVSAAGGTSPYTYSLNGGTYGTNATFSSLKAGTYAVAVKDAKGCISSITVAINNGTGNCGKSLAATDSKTLISEIDEESMLKALASPNPSIADFKLTLNGTSNEPVNIRVIDMYGRPVHQARGTANQSYKFGQQFTTGMYIIEIQQGKILKTIKIVKGN